MEQSKGFLSGFWQHIDELKKRLKVVIIAVLAATAFFAVFPANPSDMFSSSFWVSGLYRPFVSLILLWLKNAVAPRGVQLISLDVGAPFEIYFLAAFIFALLVTSPVIGYEIFKFVNPALYEHERRSVYPFTVAFTGLFIAGALFGLFVLTPFLFYTAVIFSQYVGSTATLSITSFYYMILTFVAITGLSFTIPVIFVLLVKFGIVKTKVISKNRVWFYFILYIICAIVTPDGSPLVDIALFIPMALLWEAAVQIGKRIEKNAAKRKGETQGDASGADWIKPVAPVFSCKFCNAATEEDSAFCPSCKRALK